MSMLSTITDEAVEAAWHKARNAWMTASRHGTQPQADEAAISVLLDALSPEAAGVTDEMVERAAKAIHSSWGDQPPRIGGYYKLARAALEAALPSGVRVKPVWRPTYQQIIDLVEDCRERRDKAGESSRMMARWISEGLNALYPSEPTQAPKPAPDAEELGVVAHLRLGATQLYKGLYPGTSEPLVRQSAALSIIEKLRAENGGLRDVIAELEDVVSDLEAERQVIIATERAAEARLAEAVEVLERIANMRGTTGTEDTGEGTRTIDGKSEPIIIMRGAAANEIARTFLQSLGKEFGND